MGVCTICAEYMVCLYLNSILFNERKVVPTSRMIFYTSTFEMVNFPLEREKGCQFCGEAEDEEEMKKEEEGKKEEVMEKAKEEEKEKEKIENEGEVKEGEVDDATTQLSNDNMSTQPKLESEASQ